MRILLLFSLVADSFGTGIRAGPDMCQLTFYSCRNSLYRTHGIHPGHFWTTVSCRSATNCFLMYVSYSYSFKYPKKLPNCDLNSDLKLSEPLVGSSPQGYSNYLSMLNCHSIHCYRCTKVHFSCPKLTRKIVYFVCRTAGHNVG